MLLISAKEACSFLKLGVNFKLLTLLYSEVMDPLSTYLKFFMQVFLISFHRMNPLELKALQKTRLNFLENLDVDHIKDHLIQYDVSFSC